MTTVEQQKYLKDFKALAKEILSSEEKTSRFLRDAGIHTPKGNLTQKYKNPSRSSRQLQVK